MVPPSRPPASEAAGTFLRLGIWEADREKSGVYPPCSVTCQPTPPVVRAEAGVGGRGWEERTEL